MFPELKNLLEILAVGQMDPECIVLAKQELDTVEDRLKELEESLDVAASEILKLKGLRP